MKSWKMVISVLLVALVFLLILTGATKANISGHVAGTYDFIDQGYYWEVEVNKNLFGFLTVGTSFGTPTPELVIKSFVPSGVPTRIDYKLYAEVKIKDFSIRLTDWCDHWLAQSDQDWLADRWGLTVRLRYDF